MSQAFQAFIINNNADTEGSIFSAVQSVFKESTGIEFTVERNPLTKKNKLKLTVDNAFHVSVFFESGENLKDELSYISGKSAGDLCSIRILFSPDPDNDFDDVVVILYDYLESFEHVLIYSLNQERILKDSI